MSTPSPPYYIKEDKKIDSYHWEKTCNKNHYPTPSWKLSYILPPEKKDQCNECKSK